jgi:hypothetical protein
MATVLTMEYPLRDEEFQSRKRVVNLFVLKKPEGQGMSQEHELASFEGMMLPHLDAAHNLARWLVRNDGFPLVGGRLDYLNNRPVAALVYQGRKHFINVFIWPIETGDGKATKAISRQGYQLLRWVDRDLNYWAVSDAASNELVALKELIERQTAPQP